MRGRVLGCVVVADFNTFSAPLSRACARLKGALLLDAQFSYSFGLLGSDSPAVQLADNLLVA